MSTIPAAMDALVALARRAWPNVQVLDGGPAGGVTEDDVIEIGYSGGDEADVRSTLSREQLDLEPDRESYEVACALQAWRGDADDEEGRPDARSTRMRAFELLGGLRHEIAQDPQLGGLVMLARMSTLDVTSDQTQAGPVCSIRFTVHVDAYTEV